MLREWMAIKLSCKMTALAVRTLQFGLNVMRRFSPGHGFAPVQGQRKLISERARM